MSKDRKYEWLSYELKGYIEGMQNWEHKEGEDYWERSIRNLKEYLEERLDEIKNQEEL